MLDIAYFSIEIALEAGMHTYSGGLGVLAGDTLKTFADFGFSALGISLLHEKGYVDQELDATGKQVSLPEPWDKEQYLSKLPFTIEVPFQNRAVACAAWQYTITGRSGKEVFVYFLDANLPENNEYDRTLTSYLYGGDNHYRLCQEQLLGQGGLLLLDKLGFQPEKVRVYHLNEGHASFAALALHSQTKDLELVRSKTVFTTHTPVPAGHDTFTRAEIENSLPPNLTALLPKEAFEVEMLNMSKLAIYYAKTVTCVSQAHEKVAEQMFPGHDIVPITNGVYHLQWAHPALKKLYDKHIPSWRDDPSSLQKVTAIPDEEIWQAHNQAKQELIEYANSTSSTKLSISNFTIGFARRVVLYKRATLILSNLQKLEEIANNTGPLQIIFAGEAHPQDEKAANLVAQIVQKARQVTGNLIITYLEDYNMDMALKLIPGVDLWLNTPRPPHEASGTSGMKAALNAVPHWSVLDGWWPEGWIEGVTGWSIDDLYHKLANKILPLYYKDRPGFIQVMKQAAALNGARFNTYRMVREYASKVYGMGCSTGVEPATASFTGRSSTN